jgi:hypothetical protein
MTTITLSAEQAAILNDATKPVCVCLPNGSFAGWLKRDITPKEPMFTPEEVAEAERRADGPGPWYTTREVLEHLKSLEQS